MLLDDRFASTVFVVCSRTHRELAGACHPHFKVYGRLTEQLEPRIDITFGLAEPILDGAVVPLQSSRPVSGARGDRERHLAGLPFFALHLLEFLGAHLSLPAKNQRRQGELTIT